MSPVSQEVLVIIPARGGSKGIPRKNLAPIAGKPLVYYIIAAAIEAETVTRIVVSTDDSEIAKTAELYGAEPIMRPDAISGDSSSSEEAVLQVLEHLEQSESYLPDAVAFLQATAPLTTAGDIDGTVRKVIDGESDSALAVVPFHYFLWKKDEDGRATGINHDSAARLLRQSREPEFLECGSVYVFRTDGFREKRHRFFGRVGLHVVDPSHRLEIDEQNDLDMAAFYLDRESAEGAELVAETMDKARNEEH